MDYKTNFNELYFNFFNKIYESIEKTSYTYPNNQNSDFTPENHKVEEFNNYINKFLRSELSKYN